MRATSCSASIAAWAACTRARRCGVIGASARRSHATWPGAAPWTAITASTGMRSARSASAKGCTDCTNTAAGSTSSWMPRSRVKSRLASEYGGDTGAVGMPTYSAAIISTACSIELPDSIISGRRCDRPRSSKPAATASICAWNCDQLNVRHASAPAAASRSPTATCVPRSTAQRATKLLKPTLATRSGASTARNTSVPSARASCTTSGRASPASR